MEKKRKKKGDAVDNEVVKNTKFNILKTKVSNLDKQIPDAATLSRTNQQNTDKQNLEKKFEMLMTITVLNTKVSCLFKKADYDTKNGEFENKITDHDCSNKYITTQEFNKLTTDNFAGRLKQANLATKFGIDEFVERADFDDKLKSYFK